MTSISIPSAKLTVVFKAGSLPAIDPADPRFILRLASVVITGQCNARAAQIGHTSRRGGTHRQAGRAGWRQAGVARCGVPIPGPAARGHPCSWPGGRAEGSGNPVT